MQQKSFLGYSPLGFHNVAYVEWGDSDAHPPVVCVHGLTRNGRDFDPFSHALKKDARVFCPDIVGRGKSDWLKDPALYSYPQYLSDMDAFIARIGTKEVDWVGTSMGGIIGMLLAADEKTPIRRLVINDVGPYLPLSALRRIGEYVGMTPEFSDLAELEQHLRKIYAPFGITKDSDWRHLAVHSARTLPDGKLALAHDPAIGQNFAKLEKDTEFWDVYDRIGCPVLLLHGEQSDILSNEVAQQMTQRGPKAKLVTLPGIGHAPALMDNQQIKLIEDFLRS